MSAVLAVAHKEIWQGSVVAFNVGLTHPNRETDSLGLPEQDAAFCQQPLNENAPSCWLAWLSIKDCWMQFTE